VADVNFGGSCLSFVPGKLCPRRAPVLERRSWKRIRLDVELLSFDFKFQLRPLQSYSSLSVLCDDCTGLSVVRNGSPCGICSVGICKKTQSF
jgi:hypothetical protein